MNKGLGISSKHRQYTPRSNQNGGQGCCTRLPCSIISVLPLYRERTPNVYIAMVTRSDIHPSEAEAEWMSVTHCRHSHGKEPFSGKKKTTQRHIDIHVRPNSSGLITSRSARMRVSPGSQHQSIKGASKGAGKDRLPWNVSTSQRKRGSEKALRSKREALWPSARGSAGEGGSCRTLTGTGVRHFWQLGRCELIREEEKCEIIYPSGGLFVIFCAVIVHCVFQNLGYFLGPLPRVRTHTVLLFCHDNYAN